MLQEASRKSKERKTLMKKSYEQQMIATMEVLLSTVVVDCSSSMSSHYEEIKKMLPELKNMLAENEDTKSKMEIAEIVFGSSAKLISTFSTIDEWNPTEEDIQNMGSTNMAEALEGAFNMTKERLEFYKSINKKVYSPIIFVISDGVYTCSSQEMERVEKLFDKYKRSNGSRRILLWGATTDEMAAVQMEEYCDKVFVLEPGNYNAYMDAIDVFAQSINILSSSVIKSDPITGEDVLQYGEVEEVIVKEGVKDIVSRKMNIDSLYSN